MTCSEAQKLKWQNPDYRKHMSEVHMGHKKPVNAYSFPKGTNNPNNDPQVSKMQSESKIGEKNPMWNGGISISQGYIKIKIATDTRKSKIRSKGYKLEHRLVMEEYLGRELDSKEVVHHIDFDRSNNNIDNLMLFKNSGEHMSYHHKLKGQVVMV